MDQVRQAIIDAARSRGLTLAELSRRAGKNHAYFQQFIHRRVPAELPEKVRRKTAGLLGLEERNLSPGFAEPERIPIDEFECVDEAGDRPAPQLPNAIVEIDVRAGMGGGGLQTEETRMDGNYADPVKSEVWVFPESFRREELRAPAQRLIVVEGQGDSMQPTIWPGERLVVDTAHRIPSPDGVYAIRDAYGAIVVKRLQTVSKGDPPRVLVISDNPAHENRERGLDEIEIVGKVIYGLKRY